MPRTHALMPALAAVCRETAKVFNKAKTKDGAKVEKGSAFPTCVSLNECAHDAAYAQMTPV
jgi:methionine aminopeptidase